MNLLVIRPLVDSGRSSNSVANRMSDRNFDVIDFIRDASRTERCDQIRISSGYYIGTAAGVNCIGLSDHKFNANPDATGLKALV
jgi:hypothetical protein